MCELCDQESPALSRRRAVLGAGALITAAALPFRRALANQAASLVDPVAVYPPPGYDFSAPELFAKNGVILRISTSPTSMA